MTDSGSQRHAGPGGAAAQPALGARTAPILTVDGLQFKDLNGNGALDPYEDWRLPIEARVDNLLSLMTVEEKVGQLFHPNIPMASDGSVPEAPYTREFFGRTRTFPAPRTLVAERHITNILNNGVAEPATFATWSNAMQALAEATRLGIPITFSSDPRHGAVLGAHVQGTQFFSQWPSREGQFGIAAARDAELARDFGRIIAEEYRAVGLHMILGPQIDLTTEPRWGRNAGSFSEDADLTAELAAAFVLGAQGERIGPESVLTMLKHWPGAGPHKGGKGWQIVYPGNNFEYHLIPWKACFAAGGAAVMPYYSGTPFDNGLAVNYSRFIIQETLRERFGFDGVACTDWGVIGRLGPLRDDVKDSSIKERYALALNAGVDQFGAEDDPTPVVELVRESAIAQNRVDLSVRRILRQAFQLGLFENPYVDPAAAARIVQSASNQRRGYEAQRKSIVLLANDGTLPLAERKRAYLHGVDAAVAGQYADVVATPEQAEVAILRVEAVAGGFRPGAEEAEVSIDFPQQTLALIQDVARTGVPTVVAVNLGSTLAVLPQALLDSTKALLMTFDALDAPLLDVVFGRCAPVGKLPFELPSSMDAVRKQLEDVPFDSEKPLFRFGHGLGY